MTLCMCGCNKETNFKRRFIKGHYIKGKVSPLRGIPCSEERKRKISKSKKGKPAWNKGTPASEEQKRKQSIAMKGRLSPLKGKPASEEHKRKNSESHKGEKGANWRGGISCLPYCKKWTKELREAVRERDVHICQLCSKEQGKRKHSVHHIHYDKENCYPDLICLCKKCHMTVNFNRKHYELLFMNQLNNRELLFWTVSLYKKKDNVNI